MALNKVHITKLRNGKYQVTFLNPLTKKRIRKRFNSMELARQYKKEVIVLVGKTKQEHLQFLTISELMQMHFELNPETRVDSGIPAFDSFMQHFSKIEIVNLSPNVIKSWLNDLKMKHDYAEITVAHIKGSLNRILAVILLENPTILS